MKGLISLGRWLQRIVDEGPAQWLLNFVSKERGITEVHPMQAKVTLGRAADYGGNEYLRRLCRHGVRRNAELSF